MKHRRVTGYGRPAASWAKAYTKRGSAVKQTGRTGRHDSFYTALAPGWRFKRVGSRMIHWYYEARKNRSDRPGSRV